MFSSGVSEIYDSSTAWLHSVMCHAIWERHEEKQWQHHHMHKVAKLNLGKMKQKTITDFQLLHEYKM